MQKKTIPLAPELFLTNLLTHLPACVYWKNIDGLYLGCNEMTAKMLGLKSAIEIVGKTDDDLFDLKTAENNRKQDLKAMTEGKAIHVEQVFPSKSNHNRTFITCKSPLRNHDNEIIGIMCSSIDIGPLKEKEAQLQKAKEKAEKDNGKAQIYLENIIANIPDAIYWQDTQGVIQGCNDKFAKHIGFNKPENLIGKNVFQIAELLGWDKSLAEAIHQNNLKILTTGKTEAIEEQTIFSDSTLHTVLSRKSPLKDSEGNALGLLSIAVDITQRIEMENKLREAKELAEAANIAKSNFIANISHDLRTPLHTVLGTAELLQIKNRNPEQIEFIDNIIKSGKTLLRLVENILYFSEIENKPFSQQEESFDMHELLELVVTDFTPIATQKNIELLTTYNMAPKRLIGNAQNIRRVISNLLENSIKFTKEGHVFISVEPIYSFEDNVTLQFVIEDTGIGIAEDQLTHIFERFYRADPAYTGHYKGTGLGLAIAQQLTKNMGGELYVNSQIGKGSTFRFTITLKTDKKIIEDNHLSKIFSDAHLLIIDDNAATRKNLLKHFSIKNSDAIHSVDAKKFLEKKSKQGKPFNLIIMDDEISAIAPRTLARMIRENKELYGHPILALCTTSTLTHDHTKHETYQFNPLLVKPIHPHHLLNRLSGIWQKWLSSQNRIIPQSLSLGLKILLVEDDPLIQKFTTSILHEFDCEVTIAKSGKEALEKASIIHDIILMDIGLPDMDGLKVTDKLREHYSHRLPTIVALTAHVSEEDKRRCLAAGLDDFLTKPASYEDFKNILIKYAG